MYDAYVKKDWPQKTGNVYMYKANEKCLTNTNLCLLNNICYAL